MNSHMRSLRRVTKQPMGIPWRILKVETETLARVVRGFWPVMTASSFSAASSSLMSREASPTPMLTVIFLSFGACMTLL